MSHQWLRELGTYRGLVMHCAPGTHEAAMALVRRHVSVGGTVLDLASGSGAFLSRLRDAGFSQLSSVELDAGHFGLAGITPQAIDLNSDFAGRFDRPFHMVSALEIIEHLDCPRHFLRQVHALLEDDGWLMLSTPNIAHWIGRMKFLRRGELRGFAAGDYAYQRHISPTTDSQMRLMLREVGFDLVDAARAGDFSGPAKRLLTFPLELAFRLSCGPGVCGEVSLYLARKAAPDSSSRGTTPMYFGADSREAGPGPATAR